MQGFFYDCVLFMDFIYLMCLFYYIFSVWLLLILWLCTWQGIPGILLNFFINSIQKYWELLLQGKCYIFHSLFEPDFSGLCSVATQQTERNHKKILATMVTFIIDTLATPIYPPIIASIIFYGMHKKQTRTHNYQINHQLLRYQSNELIQ